MLRVGGGRLPDPPVVCPGRIGEEASSAASLRGRYATGRGRCGLGGRIAQLRGHWAWLGLPEAPFLPVPEAAAPARRRATETAVLALAAVVIVCVTWWVLQDMLLSWEVEEVAQGTIAIPLWIPKLAMPTGAGLLLVVVMDELATTLRGAKATYVVTAERRAAAGEFAAEV